MLFNLNDERLTACKGKLPGNYNWNLPVFW